MVLTADYHTHTPYSHGKNTVAENVARAKELGLCELGITDHGFSHIAFGLRRKKAEEYRNECRLAEERYGVRVLVGMESNIQGEDGVTDLTAKDYDFFDLFVCGKHTFIRYQTMRDALLYGVGNIMTDKFRLNPTDKLVLRNTRAYINAVKNNPVDILSHLNYLCPANALEVAKCAADYGTYLELNAKKQHLTDDELGDILAKTEVRFVIGSDAHSADRVGEISRVEQQLARMQFPLDRIDNVDGRTPTFRLATLKKG